MQISWRLVFVIEYLGPILAFCFFYSQPSFIYGKSAVGARPTERDLCTQQIAFWLVIGHYVKRELESAFVHRFSSSTMPFNRIFINSSHYWILFGVGIGYYLFHPAYTAPMWVSDPVKYVLIAGFLFSEVMNLCCHIVLKNLRAPGST